MAYNLEGRILEVCDCNVLCPCWIGENPDGGTCDAVVAWQIDKGTIEGVDVSGLTIALIGHIPRNVLEPESWKVVVYVDDKASEAQQSAILKAWTGQLGGPVADLAGLIGEVVAVERAPITFDVREGKGTLTIGSSPTPVVDADMAAYTGPGGEVTTLSESVFSTIPGSPAYVSKAAHYRRNSSKYGLKDVDLENHNAVQGPFSFVG